MAAPSAVAPPSPAPLSAPCSASSCSCLAPASLTSPSPPAVPPGWLGGVFGLVGGLGGAHASWQKGVLLADLMQLARIVQVVLQGNGPLQGAGNKKQRRTPQTRPKLDD
jgi:hypothetical protein